MPMLVEEARTRQAASLKQNQQLSPSVPIDNDGAIKGRSSEIAGKAAGVGSSSVTRALQVKRADPALFEQIKRGTVTANAARTEINHGQDAFVE